MVPHTRRRRVPEQVPRNREKRALLCKTGGLHSAIEVNMNASSSGSARSNPPSPPPSKSAITQRALQCSACGLPLVHPDDARPKAYKTKCCHLLCKSCTMKCRTPHGMACSACSKPLDLRNFDLFEVKLYRRPEVDQALLGYSVAFPELIVSAVLPETLETAT